MIQQIGQIAGSIWHTLDEEGPLNVSTLRKQIQGADNVFYMALGWLAREGKVVIEAKGRSFTVSLK